jgi:hypothetical protein
MIVVTVLMMLSFLLTPAVEAQQRVPGVRDGIRMANPHTRRPSSPTPRLPDGKPNFGITEVNKGFWDLHQHSDHSEILVDPQEGIPYQPWAKALREYRSKTLSKDDPEGFCLPPGGPRAMTTPFPMQIVQQHEVGRILFIYEGGAHVWRLVYMDGRPHPTKEARVPTWMGHSVGHWEGDTLVVDTVGFNEGHWLDMAGSPRTEDMHLVERFTRLDFNTMEYEATIDDPGAYTRPWTLRHIIQWNPEGDIQEYVCQENNRYLENLPRLKIEGER